MNSTDFDLKTSAQLRKIQQERELAEEYKDLSFERMVDARYELSRSKDELEARINYLNSLISAYLINQGDQYALPVRTDQYAYENGYRADVNDTYRVSIHYVARKTLSADKLFSLGVDSALIQRAYKRREYVVVEVRKL